MEHSMYNILNNAQNSTTWTEFPTDGIINETDEETRRKDRRKQRRKSRILEAYDQEYEWIPADDSYNHDELLYENMDVELPTLYAGYALVSLLFFLPVGVVALYHGLQVLYTPYCVAERSK